jgi:isoleucyl-tRNA synthetase
LPRRYNLPLLSPVDDVGAFTSEAGEDLVGLSVLGEGNEKVIAKLAASGTLIMEEAYEHKYPYDW